MKKQLRARPRARSPQPSAPSSPVDAPEAGTDQKSRKLWQPGNLFHATTRYPWKRGAPKIDRLAGILKHGLVAPGRCKDGSVVSDLNIVMSGCSVDYDSLVFLHHFGDNSWLYTMCEPGRFFVFVDPTFPVLRQEDMAEPWAILCQDEVYVKDRVPVEKLTAIVVHEADAAGIVRDLLPEFERLRLPLYRFDGELLWPGQ